MTDDSFKERLHGFTKEAVLHYWSTLLSQGQRQGGTDAGNRANVTGGAQLDGFLRVMQFVLREAGLRDADVFTARRSTILPGYFRPTKSWDLLAVCDGVLIACIELKSQAGPSFGNNFNNRVEEAIGNGFDFWEAFENGGFRVSERPFLGYIMLLEKARESTCSLQVQEPHFPVREEFRGASYARRYELFCERLIRESLFDSAALLMSTRSEELRGEYEEPSSELSMLRFATALMGRAFTVSKRQ